MATLTATERGRLGLVRPELMNALMALMDAAGAGLGYKLAVADDGGTRSHARQQQLYADAIAQSGDGTTPAYAVGKPGTSRHEYGAAFDVHIIGGGSGDDGTGTDDDYQKLADLGAQLGLVAGYYFDARGVGEHDPYHFQLDEPLQASIDKWAAMQRAGIGKGLLLGAIVAAAALTLGHR